MRYTDFYDLLQVRPEASVEVIRAAYRALAKLHHPDAGGEPEVMKQLNEALQVLTDPARRGAYDRDRLAKHRQGGDAKSGSPRPEESGPPAPRQAAVTANRRWWQGAGIIVASTLLVAGVTAWTQSAPPTKPLSSSRPAPRAQPAAPVTRPATAQPNTPAIPLSPPVPSGINEAPGATSGAVKAPAGTFTLGSTKEQVRAMMGTPSSLIGSHWGYGLSSVEFGPQDSVVGWSNIEGNLTVYLGDRQADAAPITLGSTRAQVLAAMGTPSSVIGSRWGYNLSSVEFDQTGAVTGWSDIEGNLRLSLGDKKTDAQGFGLGSTKAAVIATMGTPSSIIGNHWGYHLSTVEFGQQATVVGWSDIGGNLKLR
jgi:hypothetical protein